MIKRVVAVLIASAFLQQPHAVLVVKRDTGAPSSCTKTNITFWWRLEGSTLDGTLDYTAGDSTALLNEGSTVARVDTDGPKMGTNGLTSPAGANSYARFEVSTRNIADDQAGTASFWVRWATGGTLPAADELVQVFAVNESSANRLRLYLVSDGSTGFKVQGYYRTNSGTPADTTVTSSGVEVLASATTWYHLRLEWDSRNADGADVLRVYVNGALKAGDAARTMGTFTTPTDRITLGMQYGTSLGSSMYFDQLIISSDPTKDLDLCKDLTSYAAAS